MEIASGVYVHLHNTKKFKDVGISLRFMAPLTSENATMRSLLAMMITDRCEAYPSKKAMSDQQDFLYGTTITAQTVGYGKAQVLDIRMKLIDPRYVSDKSLLDDALAFLHQMLFHPLLNEETLSEAKKLFKAKLERLHDDPNHYAVSRGLQLAGRGTAMAISPLGERERLEHITLGTIRKMHQRLLFEDRIDIISCGDLNQTDLMTMVKKYLPFSGRNIDPQTHYTVQCQGDLSVVKEYRKIQQCTIFMLWQTNTDICDPDYYALRMGTAMLGQYPTSLLFQEVREKRSLCYSIYAALLAYDGALGVTTGVEQEHIEQTIGLTREQFQRIASGDFKDHLLEVSKTMMIHSLKASKDAMNSIIAQQYQNGVLHQELTVEDRIALMEKVTKTAVMEVFQKCIPLTSFVVCKKGEGS